MSFYQGPTLVHHCWQFVLVAEINESCVGFLFLLFPSCRDETLGFFCSVFWFLKLLHPFCKKAKWDN